MLILKLTLEFLTVDAEIANPLILSQLGLEAELARPLGSLLRIPLLKRLDLLLLSLAIFTCLFKCIPVIHCLSSDFAKMFQIEYLIQ